MLKKILKLEGAKALKKTEQKEIKGGFTLPSDSIECLCIFQGDRGFLELTDIPCNQEFECVSRLNGQFIRL